MGRLRQEVINISHLSPILIYVYTYLNATRLNLYGEIKLLEPIYRKIGITGSRSIDFKVKREINIFISLLEPDRDVIVCGGARGIDKYVIEKCWERKVGVIIVRPKIEGSLVSENRTLLVGLYIEGVKIFKSSFLERNRIIVELSNMLVFFKGEAKSGSMSTAWWAIETGKQVYINGAFSEEDRGYGGNKLLLKKGCQKADILYYQLEGSSQSV